MNARFVRVVLSAVLVFGCLLAAPATLAEPDKPKEKEARAKADAWFPLAPGTAWTWQRTVKSGAQPAKATEEKRTVTKVAPVDAYFEVVFDQGGSVYVNADGVFNKQCDRSRSCRYAPLYPRPAKGQSNFRTMYGGDVEINVGMRPQAKPIVTKAGSFKGCIEYHFFISAAGKKVMFCPGVGEVMEYYGDIQYDGTKEEKVDKRLQLLRFAKGK
jgi:hypothetical protein